MADELKRWSRNLALQLSQAGLQFDADGDPWHDIEKMAALLRQRAVPAPNATSESEVRFGPSPGPTDAEMVKAGNRIASEVAFEMWWKTFVGSTHDAEASAKAAFLAGWRARHGAGREENLR